MRTAFSFYCIVFYLFPLPDLYAQLPDHTCKPLEEIVLAESSRWHTERLQRSQAGFDPTDIMYQRCHWQINPAQRRIEGELMIRFRSLIGVESLTFDLSSALNVEEIVFRGNALPFSHSENVLRIPLGETLTVNNMDSIRIRYEGVPPSTGLGSFQQSFHGSTPVIWTLSEPYGAQDWWPCKNRLQDKIDSMDIFITSPLGTTGAANGVLVSRDTSDDGTLQTVHWRHRYPIAHYLVAIAVTNYEQFSFDIPLGDVSLPVHTFCYPESRAYFETGNQATIESMQMFHHFIGPYPFLKEQYAHTQFSWAGGMEHQTNSFMYNVNADLITHELAHQWFGDMLTCASWEDLWLNEGFATHLASMYDEEKHPDRIYSTRKEEIDRICSQPGGSVRVDNVNDIRRIFDGRLTYTKASHLLYMLRWKLGDSAFFRGVRQYIRDAELSYGFVSTPDLQKHLEAESGQSLDSFFRQWYAGQGYPSFDIRWAQVGSRTVQIRLGQRTSHESVPFFHIPVALRFQNAGQDTTIVLEGRFDGELFTAHIGFVADTVLVDPEYWLISKDNHTERVEELRTLPARVNVYPNPFTEGFEVRIQDFAHDKIKLELYDILGKSLYSSVQNLYKGKAYVSVQLPFLAAGHYVLKVWGELGQTQNIMLTKY